MSDIDLFANHNIFYTIEWNVSDYPSDILFQY